MSDTNLGQVVQLTKEELNGVGIHFYTDFIERHSYVSLVHKETILSILPLLKGKTYPEIKSVLENLNDLTRSILHSGLLG